MLPTLPSQRQFYKEFQGLPLGSQMFSCVQNNKILFCIQQTPLIANNHQQKCVWLQHIYLSAFKYCTNDRKFMANQCPPLIAKLLISVLHLDAHKVPFA